MNAKIKEKLLTMPELEKCFKDKILISGKILSADPDEQIFKVLIGYKEDDSPILGILHFNDYSLQPQELLKPDPIYPNRNLLGKDAIFSGGNWINCFITRISENIYISRSLTQTSYCNLKIGQEVICTVTGLHHPSTFVDIGNGIIALNTIQELAVTRYEDVNNWFEIGEKFPAIITEITPDKKIFVSRKQYYKKHTPDIIKEHEMRICRICNPTYNGYFVEIDALTSGIMDAEANLNFSEGDEVVCFVQKITQRIDGKTHYHLKFCNLVEK